MGRLVAAVHAPGSRPHLLRPGGVLADTIVLKARVSCARGMLTLDLWHDNSTRLSSTPPVSRHATMPLCALTSKARPSLFLGLLPDASGLSKGHFVNSSGKPHWRLPCLRTDRRPTPASLWMPANLARRAGNEKPIAHVESLLLSQGRRSRRSETQCGRMGACLKNSMAGLPSTRGGVATVLCTVLAPPVSDRLGKYFKYRRVNMELCGIVLITSMFYAANQSDIA